MIEFAQQFVRDFVYVVNAQPVASAAIAVLCIVAVMLKPWRPAPPWR